MRPFLEQAQRSTVDADEWGPPIRHNPIIANITSNTTIPSPERDISSEEVRRALYHYFGENEREES